MHNHYLAQFLANEGLIEADDMKALLPVAAKATPTYGILTLCEGLCDAAQLPTLLELGNEEFVAVASTTGLLSDKKLEKVRGTVPDENAKFMAALLSEKSCEAEDIIKLWQRFQQEEESPVGAMIKKLAGEDLLLERDGYAAYGEIFLHTLVRFMDTPAVITGLADEPDTEKPKHIVSQQISGIGGMVVGIWAEDEVFLELARRYSHEEISEVDELALDCLTEFINVLNGLYIVNAATAEMDADLETPRVASNVEPCGNQQLILQVQTGIGKFALVLAADEFII